MGGKSREEVPCRRLQAQRGGAIMVVMLGLACSSSPPDGGPAGEGSAKPPASAKPAAPTKTLFERLGGMPAITAVSRSFVGRTTTDPRIKHRFLDTDADQLARLLAELVCQSTGGPCKYSGRTMGVSHAGMELVHDDFTALVEDLVAALDEHKVPAAEKAELLGALGPLEPQIVVPAASLRPVDDAKLAPVRVLALKLAGPAAELLGAAVIAAGRGQRSYAEQLFSRAELIAGAQALASVAVVFREGAPPRITTPLKPATGDAAQQPTAVGSSERDAPGTPERGSLTGVLQLDGKPAPGMGVVMLTPKTGGPVAKRTAKTRVIEQRDKTFLPRVTAVPVGSTIAFPNVDRVYHNVFSLSKTRAFDLGLYKRGEQREITFDKPGIVRLGCNIHANMAAHVIVVAAPHYVVVESDGNFAFSSLRPGTYRAEAWSDQGGEPSVSELVIKPGANTTRIDLARRTDSDDRPDKFGIPRPVHE